MSVAMGGRGLAKAGPAIVGCAAPLLHGMARVLPDAGCVRFGFASQRIVRGLGLLAGLVVSTGLLLPVSAIGGYEAARTRHITIALLVGNRTYQGKSNLPDLKYPDEDVLRMVRALLPFVAVENMKVLVRPAPDVAAELESLHVDSFWFPDRFFLFQAMEWVENRTMTLREQYGAKASIHVILYFSTHGDVQGIHLARGVLPGRVLMAQVDSLSADTVLLVADACFSSLWMQVKGEGTDFFPEDAVFKALSHLEKVGMISVQSSAREERDVVRGGLLTHVFCSGILGAADLDQDQRVDYEELRAYLDYYTRNNSALRHVRIKAPAPLNGRISDVVEPDENTTQGLMFPPTDDPTDTCYWIKDSGGRLVVELCKPANEWRRIILLPGRYHVMAFRPPRGWTGREGDFQVLPRRFLPVQETQMRGLWAWLGGEKGEEGQASLPSLIRPLTPEEVSYFKMSPVMGTAVSWRVLPGKVRKSIRMGASGAYQTLLHPDMTEDSEQLSDGTLGTANRNVESLTQERPFGALGLAVDIRITRLSFGYLSIGGEIDLGVSTDNLVGCVAGATVYRARYWSRMGMEWPRGNWPFRLLAVAGGFSAAQLGPGSGDCHPPSSAYRVPLGLTVGLEVDLLRETGGGVSMEVAIRPELAVEFQDRRGSAVAAFAGGTVLAGLEW